MELIEYKAKPRFAEMINHSEFSERLYFSLKECGFDIPYGIWHSKFLKNGVMKIIKSLGIYKVIGARETKKIFIHPRLKVIIDSTCGSNNEISKTIIDLVNGKYINIDKFTDLDINSFNSLPNNDVFSCTPGYGTYIIFNESNKLYKVGRTKNIIKRINDLKKEHGNDLYLVAFKSEDVEAKIHEFLKLDRVFGEWFNSSFDTICNVAIIYDFEKIENKDLLNYLTCK